MIVPVTFSDGSLGELSFQSGLVMLHSEIISAQWHPDRVGLTLQFIREDAFKMGLQVVAPDTLRVDMQMLQSYQSFHFAESCFDDVVTFFKTLRYPMDRCILVDRERLKVMTKGKDGL